MKVKNNGNEQETIHSFLAAMNNIQKYTGENYKIVHKKLEPFDQAIDRTTPWGNPFHLNDPKDEAKREACVRQYKLDLWQRIQRGDTKFLFDLIARKDNNKGHLAIGCWCAPRLCHGDVLAAACDWLEKEEFKKRQVITHEKNTTIFSLRDPRSRTNKYRSATPYLVSEHKRSPRAINHRGKKQW